MHTVAHFTHTHTHTHKHSGMGITQVKREVVLFTSTNFGESPVPAIAQWVNDLACLCGAADLISSLVQWVKDPALPQLQLGPKKRERKKKEKKKKKEFLLQIIYTYIYK